MASTATYDEQKFFNKLCIAGREEDVKKILENSRNIYNLNSAMMFASIGGNENIVELLISKRTTNWNDGLNSACLIGDEELARFIISRGANDWNSGLRHACNGGQEKMAEMMVKKGATNLDDTLDNACCNSNNLIINAFGKEEKAQWIEVSQTIIARKGTTGRLTELLEEGAKKFDWKLYGKYMYSYLRIMVLMMRHGATNIQYTYGENQGYKKCIIYFLENGITIEQLKKIKGIEKLEEEIRNYKDEIDYVMKKNEMLGDLINIMKDYSVL